MSKNAIKVILLTNNYPNHIITVLGENQYRIQIEGEVHVQQIKDLFNVIKWEYNKNRAEFYITKE